MSPAPTTIEEAVRAEGEYRAGGTDLQQRLRSGVSSGPPTDLTLLSGLDRLQWDAEGAARIAASIYCEIRNAHDWGRQFPEALSPSALDKLASMPPREMRRAIHSAFGNAKVAGRTEVGPDDIQDARARKQRIGFF